MQYSPQLLLSSSRPLSVLINVRHCFLWLWKAKLSGSNWNIQEERLAVIKLAQDFIKINLKVEHLQSAFIEHSWIDFWRVSRTVRGSPDFIPPCILREFRECSKSDRWSLKCFVLFWQFIVFHWYVIPWCMTIWPSGSWPMGRQYSGHVTSSDQWGGSIQDGQVTGYTRLICLTSDISN